METEEWRPVPGFPRYQISSIGRIRGPIKLLKPQAAGGYLAVRLGFKGPRKYIHAMVCEAWRGPRPPGCHAAHLDGNSNNNTRSNLDWATPGQNAAHKKSHGTLPHGEAHYNALFSNEQVRDMREARKRGERVVDIARRYGAKYDTIKQILMKRNYRHIQDSS